MKRIRPILLVTVLTLGFGGAVKAATASCCGSPDCCGSDCCCKK